MSNTGVDVRRINSEKHTNILQTRYIAIIVMITLVFVTVRPAGAYAAGSSGVKIGHAVYGETGNLKGNKAGDNSKEEIRIEKWSYGVLDIFRNHWKYVLRPKDHELARNLAADMKNICNNNKIGYDQNDPDCTTLYDEAKKNGWDIAGISKKCETTCSCAISVCLNAEGVAVPRKWNSSRMKKDLMDTGLFTCFKSRKYTKSDEKLVPGDILVYPGRHAAMVVESNNPFTYTLKYTNAEGKNSRLEVEEGGLIYLNPNNGGNVKSVTMDSDVDITDEKETARYHSFAGWTISGSNTLTASYTADRQEMRIEADKVKV